MIFKALINFCFVTCFFLSSCVKLSHTEDYSTPSSLVLHIREFAVVICRENILQEFAVAIGRGFFVFVSKSLFVYMINLVSIKGNLFYMRIFSICDIAFINSVSICYSRGSYEPRPQYI